MDNIIISVHWHNTHNQHREFPTKEDAINFVRTRRARYPQMKGWYIIINSGYPEYKHLETIMGRDIV